ncbi:hypothetical protein Taro_020542 [Colocasia esculenta]|uniref:Uncharacterized protein n=1 Tax=Colocasia esculenta TaxID=4460 RepID=A0A843UZ25_COLES|nr:hypothetical protein [Colocasia esculenta]
MSYLCLELLHSRLRPIQGLLQANFQVSSRRLGRRARPRIATRAYPRKGPYLALAWEGRDFLHEGGVLYLKHELRFKNSERSCDLERYRNNPQKTTELFSFGRPKEEKTMSRLNPLRGATTSTRPHHSLGTVNRRVNVVNRRPLHRQRESGGVREHPRDLVTTRKRDIHNRDGLGGRDSFWPTSGVSVAAVGVSACAPGQSCPSDLLVGNAAGWLAAFSDRK